jgi:hypothetical protein
MKPIQEMSQGEIGAYVQSHLRENGIDLVLSGGAVVSIYSSNKYLSLDLDIVNIHSVKVSMLRESMKEIGFLEDRRYFKHPDTQYYVEFPPGPLTIGDEPVMRVDDIEFSTGLLRIISPTDCVKDRLAGYYHWGDRQSLEQAVLVAHDQDVDLEEIRRWSDTEGKLDEFEKIKNRLISNEI